MSFVLFACSLLLFTSAASAETVEYWDPVGKVTNSVEAVVVTADTEKLTGGWYVVRGEVSRNIGMDVTGAVNLILADGANLTVVEPYKNNKGYNPGIRVESGTTLNIYAQSTDTNAMGRLSATSGQYGAGIGGGTDRACGTVNIYGGNVTATGQNCGAGIGGGHKGGGGIVHIFGGNVAATCGGDSAAGIGGGGGNNSVGAAGGEVHIHGGTVTATGGSTGTGGPGIGGGGQFAGGTITITGGRVTAIGRVNAPGIGGGGNGGAGGTITISGGEVTAIGGGKGAGIGGGNGGAGGDVTISGGKVVAKGIDGGAAIGGGNSADGGTITIAGGEVVAENSTDSDGAGIGGGFCGSGGTITITGGKVSATGGGYGAGIGGGSKGAGGTITISGGRVTATGGGYGAGIGGGYLGAGGTVTVNGGTVVAKSGNKGVRDIGSGLNGNYVGEFFVTGGSVLLANSGKCCDGYPTNGDGTQVYCVTNQFADGIVGKGVAVRFPSAPFAYGDKDIFTDDARQVYQWLPAAASTYAIAYENGDGAFEELIVDKREGQRFVSSFPFPSKVDATYAKPDGTSATTNAIPVDANRTELLGGNWYVVTSEVSMSQSLEVVGSANLILADGAKLTVQGKWSRAGIEVEDGNALTIWGQDGNTGTLDATGGSQGAGIGGSLYVKGGEITINGGQVTATGGTQAAGIGGGNIAAGGAVTVNGGTVVARAGYDAPYDIGRGWNGKIPGEFSVNGGSVLLAASGKCDSSPKNSDGELLYRVKIPFPEGFAEDVAISVTNILRRDGKSYPYGGRRLFVCDDGLYLYLPNGTYDKISLAVGTSGSATAKATVKDVATTAVLTTDAFLVNGASLMSKLPEGCRYDSGTGVLTVSGEGTYAFSGSPQELPLRVEVTTNATIVLSNVVITTTNEQPVLTVAEGATLTLRIAEGVSEFEREGGNGAIVVQPDANLVLGATGTAPAATRLCVRGGVTGETVRVSERVSLESGVILKEGSETIATLTTTCTGKPYLELGKSATVTVPQLAAHLSAELAYGQADSQKVALAPTGGVYTVMQNDDIKLRFETDEGYGLDFKELSYSRIKGNQTVQSKNLPGVHPLVKTTYWDVNDAENPHREAEAIAIDAGTATLWDGNWYVVTGKVSRASIVVKGTVNLILADGAKLTAQAVYLSHYAGIVVGSGNELTIWGQDAGTGTLVATGDAQAAGIGGSRYGACGTVTINGGTVTATGGDESAGIGGGWFYAGEAGAGVGGTVTINGGTVKATGSGNYAAGIGGSRNGAGGTVTINGGTVIAKATDARVWDIGPGYGVDATGDFLFVTGGSVQLANSGKCRGGYPKKTEDTASLRLITVTVNTNAAEGVLSPVTVSDIEFLKDAYKLGDYNTKDVQLIGGKLYFYLEKNRAYAFKVNDGEIDYYVFVPASEGACSTTATCLDTYTVIMVDQLDHMTAAWTSGDGTVTNAISGTYFVVPKGATDLKVIFTPEERYGLDKTEYVFDGTIDDVCTIPAEDLPTASYLYAVVTVGQLDHMTAAWTSGDGTVTNAISGTSFEVLKGTTGLKIIFTPEERYGLDKTEYVFDGTIDEDCTIPAEDLPTATYLYAVVIQGQLDHMTAAAWTSGDGTVTNAISGTSFWVPAGTTGVKIIFTPKERYELDKTEYVFAEPINGDCTIPAEALPTALLVLPEGYVRVEYIESTVGGGQYIDTGVKASSTLAATMDYMAFEHTGRVNLGTFAADNADWRYFDHSGGPVFDCGSARTGSTSGNTLDLNVRYVVNVGSEGDNICLAVTNAETKAEVKSFKAARSGAPSAENVFIFGGYSGDSLVCTSMRLYSLALRDFANIGDAQRTILAEFVPCMRESDGVVGLYDIENGVFKENEGSGSFVAKNDRLATVTVPSHAHVIAFWTSGDGSVTNRISGAVFQVLKDVPFKVLFTSECNVYALEGPSVYESAGISADLALTDEQVPVAGALLPVEYVDADGSVKSRDVGEYVLMTEATSQLTSGWYVIAGKVSHGSITVNGDVHLILPDGCELTAKGGADQAGVVVEPENSLTIYGQSAGTGNLTATGGRFGAGIGGGSRCAGGTVTVNGGMVTATGGGNGAGIGGGSSGAGGTVTVNGGTITATSDRNGAGIGGGSGGAGGTVTINGGTVTATGGGEYYGAGIGGGSSGAGGTVTVNGGTVTATGGDESAGIGGGAGGAGGEVTIINGRLDIKAGDGASVIGAGKAGDSQGKVEISGGIFSWKPNDEWIVDPSLKFMPNPDATTSKNYPWAALPVVHVTFGRPLAHMTAAWTSGDGTVTNAISGTTFEVLKGTTGLKIIFTPEERYGLDKTEYVFEGTIDDDVCTIPAEELPTATYLYAVVTVGQFDHMTAAWTSGDGTVTNAIEGMSFEVLKGTMGCKVIFTPEHNYQFVDVNETGVRELDSPLTKDFDVTPPQVEGVPGTVVNPWNVGDAVTAYVSDDGTLVISGTGAMDDFASAADAPWHELASEVSAVTVADGVTHIGKNAFAGFADTVKINGIPSSFYRMMGGAYGMSVGQSPSGAISGAEFERVQIIDGKAYLDVSVYTSDTLTNQNWSVATNGVIEVPAPGKQGFFYLMSKPAAPSNRSGRPDTADVQHD